MIAGIPTCIVVQKIIAFSTFFAVLAMSKLSRRPNHHVKKLTWSDLDSILLSNFSESTTDKPRAVIELSNFEMSKSEIIEEATAQGYQVIDNSDGYLKFL